MVLQQNESRHDENGSDNLAEACAALSAEKGVIFYPKLPYSDQIWQRANTLLKGVL